jgi:hypothetical protein
MTQRSSTLAKIPYTEYLSELLILSLFNGAVSTAQVNNVKDNDWKTSRDIFVGIATGYWTAHIRFLPRSILHSVQKASPIGIEGRFQGIKPPVSETGHPTFSSAKIKTG